MPNSSPLVPPSDIGAEKCVLGSVLLDPTCLLRVSSVLQPEDFYQESHRTIYAAMVALMRKRVHIDFITLTGALKDRGALDAVGGAGEVVGLTEYVPTASRVDDHAEIVASKAYQRRLIHFGNSVQQLAFQPNANPADVREQAESLLLAMGRARQKSAMVSLGEVLDETYNAIAEAADAADPNARFVFSGFTALDHMLGGMEKSDMVVLAARPSMGKTAMALSMAQNVARAKKHVAIFSLEMGRQQLARRLLSSEARVDGMRLRSFNFEDDDQRTRVTDAISAIHDLPIHILDSSGVSLTELRSHTRRAQMEHGIDFLVVDYIQLMSSGGRDGRTNEVSEISRGIKALARELDIPILCLSQLSRGVESRENKVPNLSDLRESGSIEQDADVVLMLYRDDYYNEKSTVPGEVEVHIKKNRSGPTGKVSVRFDRATTTFRDILPTPEQTRFTA